MKRRIFAMLLAVLMVANVFAFTVSAEKTQLKLEALPEADILDLVFTDEGTGVNNATKAPWSSALPKEYSSGTSGAVAWSRVAPSTFTVGDCTYTENAYTKTSSSNSIGVDFSANKSAFTAALTDGFTAEVAFIMPTTTGSTQAIFGAANDGGFGLYLLNSGKLCFEVGKSGGGYTSFNFSDTFTAGEFVHVIAGFDGAKIFAYANGVKQGSTALSAFRAGGYFGAIGLGGSTASTTNYSKSVTGITTFYTLKLYNTAFTEEQMQIEYARYMASLNLVKYGDEEEAEDSAPAPEILDLVLTDEGEGVNNATETPWSLVEPHEYASGASGAVDWARVSPTTFTYNGKTYKANAYQKTARSNSIGVDFSANKSALTAALKDGFTVETSFIMKKSTDDQAIFGAANGGGFALYVRPNSGTLRFQVGTTAVGSSSNTNVNIDFPQSFEEGEFVHVIAGFDGENTIYAYANGVKMGTNTLPTGFNAGGYFGAIGFGGSTASASNYSKYTTQPTPLFMLKLYDSVLTEEQMLAEYASYIASLKKLEYDNTADILDLEFGDKTVANVAGTSVVSTVGIKEYSASGTETASFTNFGEKDVTVGDKSYKANVFYKNSKTNTMMISFKDSQTAYTNALADGFTLEAAFDVPTDETGGTYWGANGPKNAEAVISSMNGGGYIIAVSHTGSTAGYAKIYFAARDSVAGGNIPVIAEGEYKDGEHIYVTAQLDKANSKVRIYINGVLKGEETFSGTLGLASGANAPYLAVGGSLASSTNPTNYACAAPLNLSTLKIRDDVLTAEEVAKSYQAEYAKIGAAEPVETEDEDDDDPTEPTEDEDAKVGDSIVKLLFAKNGKVYAVEHSLGKPVITAYNSKTAQSGYAKVGEVSLSLGGKTVKTAGFEKDASTDLIGIDMSTFAADVVDELEDGFSVETGFVVPSGLKASGYNYFVGGVKTGGMGICAKDGDLCFVIRDASGFKFVTTDMPEVGTYCHVIGTYDATANTIEMWLNGVKVGTTAVGAFSGGTWGGYASVGLGGTPESAVNYTTNTSPAGTIITALDLHGDALTEEEAKAAYEAEMARLGFTVIAKVLDDDFEPVLRFLVTSDVHIGSATDARAAKLAGALSDAYTIARTSGNRYEKLDAIEIIGDIADNGTLAQMQAVKSIFDNGIDYGETQLLVTMGNHDYYDGNSASKTPAVQEQRFDDTYAYANDTLAEGATLLAENRAPNTHYKINGYHFINLSVDGSGWSYSQAQVNWLKDQLDAAAADTGANKPIFVFHHIGEIDTVVGTDHYGADAGISTLTSLLQQYPQVVDFSGHSHQPVNTPFSLLQEGCTMVGTGTLKSSGQLLGDGATMQAADGVSLWDVSQVLVVEVDAESRTRIRVYDILKDKFMSQSWIFDGYTSEDFTYTRHLYDNASIVFGEDAELNITKTTGSLVSFNFDTVSPESEILPNAFIAEVIDGDGNTVASRYLRWAFYDENYDAVLSTAIGGLEYDTDYTLKITAVSSLYTRDPGKAGGLLSENSLTKTFRTLPYSEAPLTADILDVSIGTSSISDGSGNMSTTVSGSPIYAYDSTIGMNTIKFDANSKYVKFSDYKDAANDISYGFTMEAYFRIDEFNCDASNSKSPMGSEQTGGFGFDIKPEKQVMYSVYTGGYKTISKTQEVGKFYHWVGSYDGAYLTVYVNGHKIGKLAAPAPMTFTGTDAEVFYIGADTTASGGAERQGRTTVALTRIYSQPANDAQALGMWEAVRELQDTEAYPGDGDDPEYLFWEQIDDLDEEVTIYDYKNSWTHDHANDNPAASESTGTGICMTFNGSHLFNGACHAISGTMRAKVTFTGTAFRYVLQYRGPANDYASEVDVYVDGEFYTTVTGLNANNSTARYVALEILGMEDKLHEITLISHDGYRFTVDLFEIVRGTGEDEDGEAIEEPVLAEWNVVDCVETDYIEYLTANGVACDVSGLTNDGQLDSTGTWQFFNGGHLQNSTGIFGNYATGASIQFAFEGTGIRYVTHYRGPETADIDVYIDGAKVTTVTGLSAGNDTNRFVVYENASLANGKHTVQFVIAKRGQMPFDYFEVFGTPLAKENIASWQLVDCLDTDYVTYFTPDGVLCDVKSVTTNGGLDSTRTWQVYTDAGHHQNGTGVYGNYVDGAYIETSFEGTGIRFVTQYRGPNSADIDVYIDGVKVETVTGISANNDTSRFVVYENASLAPGEHTVKFVAVKNGERGQMPLDYIEIFGTPIAVGPEDDVLYGDADGNGTVEQFDITVIAQYLAGGYDIDTIDENVCDVDGNGVVEQFDITLIAQYLAGGYEIDVLGPTD